MNTIKQINVNYLRPNITMETLLLEKSSATKTVVVYNYRGVHFRVFGTQKEGCEFVRGEPNVQAVVEFVDENELDAYLQKVVF